MPRLRRRGNARTFRTRTEARIFGIVQDLHRQRAANPAGPWTAPRCTAGVMAVFQFKREVKSCHE